MQVSLVLGTDGTHGAGHQGHGGPHLCNRVSGLGKDPGVVTPVREGPRRELVAGATVDAGAIHEEGTGGIVRMGIRAAGHGPS